MIDLRNERVLVTGGKGFLGRHVCARLADMGVEMWAPSHEEMELLADGEVWARFQEYAPSVVVHLAAYCGGIGLNQSHPFAMIATNTQMAVNVTEAAQVVKATLVVVGSVCSYPKYCPVPFRESDLWNGYPEETNAGYGVAKRTLFELAKAWHQEFGLQAACLIPANLYGPGDNFDPESSHVIPAIIRKMVEAKGRPVTLWGTGRATREFLYVEDCADAIIRAAERIDDPSPINIGTGKEISIYELAHVIADVVGFKGEIRWDASRPDGQPRRCLDVSKAKSLLDWEARVALHDGLRQTVEWYLNNRKAVAA